MNRLLLTLSFAILAGVISAHVGRAEEADETPAPPVAKKVEKVDIVHGERRVDDYAWMKDKGNPGVIAYLEAENRYTDATMKPFAAFGEALYKEMLARIKQTDLSVPYRRLGYYYYSRTEEGKQYSILCRKKGSLEAPEEVMLDGNARAEGHSFWSIGSLEVSDDGSLLAFAEDVTGYRQYTLRVKDLRSGAILPFSRERVTSVAWAADNRRLFYTVEDARTKRSHRLYRLRVDAATGDDPLLYEEKDDRFGLDVGRSRSGAYIVANTSSLTTSEVRVLRADAADASFVTIEPRTPGVKYDVDHRGELFYIRVNDTGRNFRIVTAPVERPARANWTELVPHRASVMLWGLLLFKNHLVLVELENALTQLSVRDLTDRTAHRVAFPEPLFTAFPSANPEFDTTVVRYSYQSFLTPSSVYDYDMSSRQQTLLKQTEVLGGYDKTQYAMERAWATASDGVKVPVSLVYRRNVARDGTAPVYLTGYGSYGFPSFVSFSSNRLSLLDRGVVVALAHIRGGGDLGKPWHDEGRMMKKRNTFTDFIAVADFLVAQKYGARDRLVIEGGSAGGLLIGAVINLRPDVARAAILQVPFVDVINTMLDETAPLTVAEFEEWGNPRNKDEYDYIKTYCPYTNLAAKAYPAMLVKTSLNDSQVLFHEPTKYVAKLRSLRTDANPLIFKVNMGAGHGGSSGRYDRLREVAFDYAFMLWQMGVAKGDAPGPAAR